jgi:hypothetical protein
MTRLRPRFLYAVMALVVLLGASAPLWAQLAANEVYQGQSFSFVVTHDGVNTTHYRMYRAGTVVQTLSASARNATTGDVQFGPRTEATTGTVVYEFTAVNINTSGEAESPRLAMSVAVKLPPPTAPSTPTLPRLIRVALP